MMKHKTPNGLKITFEELDAMLSQQPLNEVAEKLGYKDPSSIRRLVTLTFQKEWKHGKYKRMKGPKGLYVGPKGKITYITKNGTKITARKLKEMLKEYTVKDVAEMLGYERGSSTIKHIMVNYFKEEWKIDTYVHKSREKMIDGMLTFTTPNGTVVDADMLKTMISNYGYRDIADRLGYGSTGSISVLKEKLLGKNTNLNDFTEKNNDIEFLAEIHRFLIKNRYAPTISDLSYIFGLSQKALRSKLGRLRKEGVLDSSPHRSGKSYLLTDKGITKVFGDEYLEIENNLLNKVLCTTG